MASILNFASDLNEQSSSLLDSFARSTITCLNFSEEPKPHHNQQEEDKLSIERDNSFEQDVGEELFHYDPNMPDEEDDLSFDRSASTNENSHESSRGDDKRHQSQQSSTDANEENQSNSEEDKQQEQKNEDEPMNNGRDYSQSDHLMRPDNVRKATIRALNKILKTYIDESLIEYKKITKINLKKKFSQRRVETYNFIKDRISRIIDNTTSPEISERKYKGIYAILFHMCLRKKNPMDSMISFSNKSEMKSVERELLKYIKQGQSYTKADGEFCFNHILMKTAKRLYFGNVEYREVFKQQALNTNKKAGIIDPEGYFNRLEEEINRIPEYL
ncbi:unnamed protein product [Moneuplotes crassus]|uniref:Uncharacterized protein n=1 Tax=Euplotes crassus TaxID=5936 RepID=A0AAD1XL59_EUPCR|nr:unnamed protein product [Moneuplotes crassus]